MNPDFFEVGRIRQAGTTWQKLGLFAACVGLPLVLASLVAIFFVDAPAAAYLKPRFGNALHLWARETTDVAKAGPYFAIAGGSFLFFFALARATGLEKWRRAQDWALHAVLAFALSGLLVQFLKHLIGRKRPYADAGLSSHDFQPFSANYEFHSLPSGHSQVLFTAASILTAIWPRIWWLWLSVAGIFATTRIITLNHWVSDVIAGAAVGMLGTVLTFRLLNYRRPKFRLGSTGVGLILAFGALIVMPRETRADAAGPVGVGIVIGDPTGLSANYRLSSQRSVDAAVAWAFGSYPGFELHSDYLWHRNGLLRAEKVAFDLHYGIGARLISISDRHASDRTYFGPRLPLGLSTNFNQSALEVFGELALVMNLVPGTSADFDFGIGARVYF